MNLYRDLLKTIFYVYVYYFRLLQMMGLYTFIPEITVLDKEHEFFNKKQEWFLEKIKKLGNQKDVNIDSLFYNKELYEEYMNKSKHTDLEDLWRNRISFLYTPRGNVIMYYDAYRMGFGYFSDQSKLSYEILNACAMNYVIQNRCVHFYIDETTYPNFNENPIAMLQIEELQKSGQSSQSSQSNQNSQSGQSSQKYKMGFKIQSVEPKQNSNVVSNKKTDIGGIKQIAELPKLKNKFIHIGKISNMNILKQPVISKKNILFKTNIKSEIMDMLDENANAQNNIFSYSDYKKMKGE